MGFNPDTTWHVNSSQFRACEVPGQINAVPRVNVLSDRREDRRGMAKSITTSLALLTAALGVTGFVLARQAEAHEALDVPSQAVLVAVPEPQPPQVAAEPAEPAASRLIVVGAGAAERVRLTDALDAFRAAGLPLPELEVVFSDGDHTCQGHFGTFDRNRDPWRISICSEWEFVILHELAHAWAAAELDKKDRDRYLAARGFDSWDDHDAPWAERGTEDAAFIVQQNVMRRRSVPTGPTWDERIAAYELLTGRPSPLASATVVQEYSIRIGRLPGKTQRSPA